MTLEKSSKVIRPAADRFGFSPRNAFNFVSISKKKKKITIAVLIMCTRHFGTNIDVNVIASDSSAVTKCLYANCQHNSKP